MTWQTNVGSGRVPEVNTRLLRGDAAMDRFSRAPDVGGEGFKFQ
jgi:hypothetical protein